MIPVKITVQKKRLPAIDKDRMLRTIAEATLGNMRYRIHTEGLDSSGNGIGTYSDPYMKLRERKGKGTDTKVIASFTRQMQNDMQIVPTNTGYGIGYSNTENYNKSKYVEATYDKKIFSMTKEELKQAEKIAADYIRNIMGR